MVCMGCQGCMQGWQGLSVLRDQKGYRAYQGHWWAPRDVAAIWRHWGVRVTGVYVGAIRSLATQEPAGV